MSGRNLPLRSPLARPSSTTARTSSNSPAPRREIIDLDPRAGRGILFPGWTERTVRDSPVGVNEKRTLHGTPTLQDIASTVVRGSPAAKCSPNDREQLPCERTHPTWRAPRVPLNGLPIQRLMCLRRDSSAECVSCHGLLPSLDLVVRLRPVNCPRYDRPSFDPVPPRCLSALRRGSYDECERLHPPTSGSFFAR